MLPVTYLTLCNSWTMSENEAKHFWKICQHWEIIDDLGFHKHQLIGEVHQFITDFFPQAKNWKRLALKGWGNASWWPDTIEQANIKRTWNRRTCHKLSKHQFKSIQRSNCTKEQRYYHWGKMSKSTGGKVNKNKLSLRVRIWGNSTSWQETIKENWEKENQTKWSNKPKRKTCNNLRTKKTNGALGRPADNIS